jgi:TolB-like protein
MRGLWNELKKRNVFRAALFYIVASWLILQVADLLFEILDLPSIWLRAVFAILLLGFPIALILSWIYEITPDGVKRESVIDRTQPLASTTGRRLNVATIVMVALGAGILLADRFFWPSGDSPGPSVGEGIPTVAVLPFKATGSEDGGFLAGGLHDDLLTRLARLEAFKVISRTSVMEYANTTKNMRQIGKELNARYILEGGVQALGSRVRVNAQLIDTDDDEHIWADTFDHELTASNLFDIQASLAKAIAGEMKTSLSESDQILIDQIPTQSIEAYNAYLRGLELRDRGGHHELNTAQVIAAFEEAVALDPEFAVAWAQLSIERSRDAQGTNDQVKRDAAKAALERARMLQPDLHEVELARVVYLYRVQFEYRRALDALEALEDRGSLNSAELALKAYLLRRLGHWDEAYGSAVEAHNMDPRSIAITANLIGLAGVTGHCEEAGKYARIGMALDSASANMLTRVADYELQCNGDAQRANRLLRDVEFTGYFQIIIARDAAEAARDYPRMLELWSHSIPLDIPALQYFDSLFRVKALRYLGRHRDADIELAAVGEALLSATGSAIESWFYAAAMSIYYTLQRDPDSIRTWFAETDRRRDAQTNGDFATAADGIGRRAIGFAYAGLYDEAIAELGIMVKTPGTFGLPFIDSLPQFDDVRDRADYIALFEQQ